MHKNNNIRDTKALIKLDELKKELPSFMEPFIEHLKTTRSLSTSLEYVRDIRNFFINSILKEHSIYDISEIDIHILASITSEQIETYLMPFGKSSHDRVLSSIRIFYSYLINKQLIATNPCSALSNISASEKISDTWQIENDDIISRVEEFYEVLRLTYINAPAPSDNKINTALRNLTIVTMFMETGIKDSECTHLDVDDVNLNNQTIRISRKGHWVLLPMSQKLKKILELYIDDRNRFVRTEEKALFVSYLQTRIESIPSILRKINFNKHGITTQTFRRYFTLKAHVKNMPIDAISSLLGCNSMDLIDKTYLKWH